MYVKLNKKRIQEIERAIDNVIASRQLPGASLADARWALLTSCEDILRIMFARGARYWTDVTAMSERAGEIHRLDEVKYFLRIALLKVDREKAPGAWTLNHFLRTWDQRYIDINEFIFGAARFYMRATGIYAYLHEENPTAWGYAFANKLLMNPDIRERQYRLVEALAVEDIDDYTPLPMLAAAFLGDEYEMQDGSQIYQGEHFKSTIKSVKLRNGRLSYAFIKSRLESLYRVLLYQPKIIPREWEFPWGDLEFSTKFFCCLTAMCHMHIVAIYFGSQRHNLQGGGLDQVCIILKKTEFVRRICLTTGLSEPEVSRAIDLLTYGNLVDTPDLSLQPFVRLDERHLIIAPLHTFSSNWARNCLSLHARIAKSTFDAQSNLFEAPMINRIFASKQPAWVGFKNVTFKKGRRKEEVDLLLIDHASQTILVCECKWSIPPGDPKEVFSRRRAHFQKVGQADRKALFIEENMGLFDDRLGLGGGNFAVRALVLCEGYGGHPSHRPDIPIIPAAVFKYACENFGNLDKLHAVFSSSLWLPRPGIDCHSTAQILSADGVEVGDLGLAFTSNEYFKVNLLSYLSDAVQQSRDELSAFDH